MSYPIEPSTEAAERGVTYRPTIEHNAATQESAAPSLVNISKWRNVTELLTERVRAAPDHIAFETRAAGASLSEPWQQISTSEFLGQVVATASGLIANGVQPGDRVLVMAATQYLWAVADYAALFAGAVVVPVYDTSSDAQLQSILNDAKPVAAFAGNNTIALRLANIQATISANPLKVWAFEGTAENSHQEPSGTMADLTKSGTHITNDLVETRRLSAGLDDIATIVYTSGTTGAPKGAQITHRNLVGQILNTAAAYREVVKENGNTVLFLPLTHVLGRALQLICVANGMRVAHLANPKDVVQALAILQPTFLVVVPRVLEKIQAAAAASARQKKIERLWLVAVRVAERWGRHMQDLDHSPGARAPLGLRAQHALFDKVFYRRLRAVMGNKIEYLLSGAATLQPELALFFRGIGVPVIEGYGLTETTAPLTGGRPGNLLAGNVGQPMPGNRIKIAANGEVLAKGVGVFAGYRDDEQNSKAFTDGYFHTGDLGNINPDGSLTLRGRLNNVIVTSTGYTVSPDVWEQAVESHALVAHAAVVGTDRPYLTALLVLEKEASAAWLDARDSSAPTSLTDAGVSVCDNPQLTAEIEHVVDQANASVSPSQQVQHWRIVTIGDDCVDQFVTPTMKLKRHALIDAMRPIVDDLYR